MKMKFESRRAGLDWSPNPALVRLCKWMIAFRAHLYKILYNTICNTLRVICHINPFMPSGFFYLNFFDRSIFNRRGVWVVLLLPCFKEIPVNNANSVDPDPIPRSVASDLDLDCLPISFSWDARHKWVQRNWQNGIMEGLLTTRLLTQGYQRTKLVPILRSSMGGNMTLSVPTILLFQIYVWYFLQPSHKQTF